MADKKGFGKFLSGLGSGLAGGLPGFIFSGLSSIFTNRGARKRQKTADQIQRENWNLQNIYNTPTKQMERLKAAGLNPNLIYGSGSANTGVAGSIAPSKAAPYNVKDPTPSVMQSALFKSQIDLNQANAYKATTEANKTKDTTPGAVSVITEQAAQQALNTLELKKSYKKRIKILGERVKQEKSATNLKAYDSFLVEQGTRVNDFIGWRKLAQLWGFFTGTTDITPWLEKNIPNNKKIQEAFTRYKAGLEQYIEDKF